MNLEAWREIAATWDEMARRIDKDLPPSSDGAVPAPMKDGATVLTALRRDLEASLAKLLKKLRTILTPLPRRVSPEAEGTLEAELTEDRSIGGDEQAKSARVWEILVPIAICMDERVLVRLPASLAPRWNRLQRDFIGSDNGGVVFYERLQCILDGWYRDPIQVELYYHCLSDGFRGRCVGKAGDEEIERHRAELERLIERPDDAVKDQPPASTPLPALPSRARYWAIAIASMVLIPLAARMLFS